MTPEASTFPLRRATPPETLGLASPTLLPSDRGPVPPLAPKAAATNASNSKMVTKRSGRSFVEEELASEQRECRHHQHHQRQQAKPAGAMEGLSTAIGDSTSTSSTTTSTTTALPRPVPAPLSTCRDPTIVTSPGVERRPPLSSSNSSSRISVSSSLYSTSSSMASETLPGNGGDSDDALSEEPPSPGFAPDGQLLPDDAPHNFGTVIPGLFRSSYPRPENYDFIQQLGLKTIVTLVDKNFTEGYKKFMDANHIQHHIIRMKGTKKEEIPLPTMEAILAVVLDRKNHPLLIHCNHGKHRTGCVVAVVRKIAGWDTPRIIGEYKAYAGSKMRDCDVKYIADFNLASIPDLVAKCNLDFNSSATNEIGETRQVALPAARWLRVPNFFRATVFSVTVLLIWMVSGSKFTAPNRR